VLGTVIYKNSFIDDQVLLKSDGFPTYHLANVVDDHLMEISHVIRGEEWLNSSPKHVLLYKAFGWSQPQWAHLPLLLNADKTKLSKRHGDVSVDKYIDEGYFPSALINFIALLGWNPGGNDYQEIFTMDELIQKFSLQAVNTGRSIVSKDKLDWINSTHFLILIKDDISQVLNIFLPKLLQITKDRNLTIIEGGTDPNYLQKVLQSVEERYSSMADLVDLTLYFFVEPNSDISIFESLQQINIKEILSTLLHLLISSTLPSDLSNILSKTAQLHKIKPPVIFRLLRLALTGREKGLELTNIVDVLGKENCVKRVELLRDRV